MGRGHRLSAQYVDTSYVAKHDVTLRGEVVKVPRVRCTMNNVFRGQELQ